VQFPGAPFIASAALMLLALLLLARRAPEPQAPAAT
jgi:hypothetical protein